MHRKDERRRRYIRHPKLNGIQVAWPIYSVVKVRFSETAISARKRDRLGLLLVFPFVALLEKVFGQRIEEAIGFFGAPFL